MDFIKKHWLSITVGAVTLLLGVLAILTAIKLTSQRPVAPTSPQSKPQALEGVPVAACTSTFDINMPTPTPSASPAGTCIEVAKQVLPTSVCQEATVHLSVHGPCTSVQRQPLDVMIVFDRSISMSPRIANAKLAADALISQLDSTTDRIGLVTFSNSATLNIGLTNNFTNVTNQVNSLIASGSTNIGDAVFKAQQEISTNGRSQAVPVIILLSDGVATRAHDGTVCVNAPTTTNYCIQDAINQATTAKGAGTTVFTVGIDMHSPAGVDTQQVLDLAIQTLQNMASSTNTFYDSPASSLTSILSTIAQVIINTITHVAVITDVLPSGVHLLPNSANPVPTTINGQTLIWNLGLVSNVQQSDVTFQVSFDSGDANQLVDVYPTSRLDYIDSLDVSYSVPFPETRFSPLSCQPIPTSTPTPTPTHSPSPTPTRSPSPIPTPSGTPTPTPTPTPTTSPIPTPSNIGGPVCGTSCTTTPQCPINMICYIVAGETQGLCRNPSCQTDTDCSCDIAQAAGTPTPTPSVIPDVPLAGNPLPTFFLIGAGLILLLVGLVLI